MFALALLLACEPGVLYADTADGTDPGAADPVEPVDTFSLPACVAPATELPLDLCIVTPDGGTDWESAWHDPNSDAYTLVGTVTEVGPVVAGECFATTSPDDTLAYTIVTDDGDTWRVSVRGMTGLTVTHGERLQMGWATSSGVPYEGLGGVYGTWVTDESGALRFLQGKSLHLEHAGAKFASGDATCGHDEHGAYWGEQLDLVTTYAGGTVQVPFNSVGRVGDYLVGNRRADKVVHYEGDLEGVYDGPFTEAYYAMWRAPE